MELSEVDQKFLSRSGPTTMIITTENKKRLIAICKVMECNRTTGINDAIRHYYQSIVDGELPTSQPDFS